ncbi:UPF0481 protein At3g47200-like [Aristolochia californica]|uniref:UPF0481 protein At3g47200-like n=1 Tax=Aristolochia californica TaxID=171875 RepID=UPI0035D86E2F
MLENDNPDVETQRLLRHYYDHLFFILVSNESKSLQDYLQMIYDDRGVIARWDYAVEDGESIDFPYLLSLLLSGCFIIHLLSKPFIAQVSPVEDPECARLWVHDLWVDLLLLENQIPFFILERIAETAGEKAMGSGIGSVTDRIIYGYFEEFIPLNRLNSEQFRPLHLLHYVHQSLLPDKKSDRLPFFSTMVNLLEKKQSSSQPPMMRIIPTATRLQEAGVEFMPVEEKGFVVEFQKGVLRLPRLQVRRSTKKFLKNVIAWEQYHHEAVKYVINYAILMDYLVNTSKDIEILIRSKILEHSLPTHEEVAAVFNSLGEDIVYTYDTRDGQEYDFLRQLSKELNEYCENRFNNWWAKLMSDYFGSPWSIASLVAALFLILFTATQTFFSGYSYFRPPK